MELSENFGELSQEQWSEQAVSHRAMPGCPCAAQAACPAPGKGQDGRRESLTFLAFAPKNGRAGVEIQQADV